MDFDEVIENNLNYFKHRCEVIVTSLDGLKGSYKVLMELLNEIESFASFYDFDKEVQGNGYRSFVDISRAHVIKAYELCQKLKLQREKLLFHEQKFIRGLQRYNIVIDELVEIGRYFIESRDKSGSLFTEIGIYDNKLTKLYESMNHKEGYKASKVYRTKSFQGLIDQTFTALAAHSQSFYSKQSQFIKYFIYFYYYCYYLISEHARVKRAVELFKNLGVVYFQDAMNIYEHYFLKLFETIIEPRVTFQRIFKVDVMPLKIASEVDGHEIDVKLPMRKSVGYYLFMNKDRIKQPSKYLIFHIHGGGFFSQSPKAHGAYLKTWANELDVPVLSINYSLSPQAVFPEALDQCFYMYCLALKHPQRFGWTGEKIVLTGDSAGGNLVTACTITCIETGIPRPTGVFPAYGVFLQQYLACPSRFLSFYDTIVPFNLYNAMFSSYHGFKESGIFGENDVLKNKSVEHILNEKTTNHLCSPYYAPSEVLEKFPPTCIITSTYDPCLDECVEFAKRMKKSNANVQFKMLGEVPHGFLSLNCLDSDCKEATTVCTGILRTLLHMKEETQKM